MDRSNMALHVQKMKAAIMASDRIESCPKPPLTESDGKSNYMFISYPHKDYKCVYCDLWDMYANGVKYWYDRGLQPGKNWETEVSRRIMDPKCSGIVYYLSENSFTKSMVFEIGCAKRNKNYFSINISGKNAMALLFAGGMDGLQITQEEVSCILDTFSSKITYIGRDRDPSATDHFDAVLQTLRRHFNVVDDSGNERKAMDLRLLAEQLEQQGKFKQATEVYKQVLGLNGISPDALSYANLQIADYYEKNDTSEQGAQIAMQHVQAAAELGSGEALYKMALYHKGMNDYQKAAQYYLKAAKAGHTESQYQAACHYHKGWFGTPQDVKQALYWYEQAANGGHRQAKQEYAALKKQTEMSAKKDGEMTAEELYQKALYHRGMNDYKKAAQYYLKAAKAGHVESQYQAACHYHKGWFDVPQDVKQALYWYEQAANGGHRIAAQERDALCRQLRIVSKKETDMTAEELYETALYHRGMNDYKKAAQYYLKAAKAGHVESQYQAACHYHKGWFDVPQDVKQALYWYEQAANGGHTSAKKEYDALKEVLSSL